MNIKTNTIFFLLIFSCLSFTNQGIRIQQNLVIEPALTGNSTYSFPQYIELASLISIFLISEKSGGNVMDWSTGSINGQYPIKWLSTGIENNNESTVKPYLRHGEAIITLNGKPIQMLRNTVEAVSWDIYLVGARPSYSEIQISIPITTRDLGEFKFDKYLRSQKVQFRQVRGFKEEIMFGNKGYAVQFPNKKQVYINYEWSAGSAGLSFGLFIYFSEKELDVNEYSTEKIVTDFKKSDKI